MDFSPKCYLFCECNSVRIGQNSKSKTRYRWKDLSLKKLSFINLYVLDESGRIKEHCVTRQNEPRTNRVPNREMENRVSSFEKPASFIFSTRRDFEKRFISRETCQ